MVVDKIGNTGNIVPASGVKLNKTVISQRVTGSDSVSISTEAQKAQEIASSLSTIKQAPDARKEKIDAIKQKLADGFYEKDTKILEKVAEKIAQALLR